VAITPVVASINLGDIGLNAGDGRIDLSLTGVAKTAGDMARNTNAGLSCGAGPVVSNGSLWKGLYSGATY